MVLRSLFFILSFVTISSDFSEGPLLSKYLKKSHKVVTKHLGAEIQEIKRVEDRYAERYIINQGAEKLELILAEVAACKLGGCATFAKVSDELASEYFDLLIILDANNKILDLKILDYFSDYGYEVNSKRYLKKFIGKSPCIFENGNDNIDAISGATISSMALEGTLSLLCK